MTTLIESRSALIEKAVADGKINLSELLQLLAEAEAEQLAEGAEPTAQKKHPAPGKALALSEENRVVLRTIPVELANVVLPGEPKLLDEAEAKQLIPLFVDLKKATKALEKAEAAIKEAFHQNFDLQAPEGSELDGNGHYLTEGELSAPGLDKKIVRGVNGGKAAGITEQDLANLEADGLIDHKTYLDLTVTIPATRTIAPEDKIMAVLKKRPELVRVLATKARLTAKSTAIRISDNA